MFEIKAVKTLCDGVVGVELEDNTRQLWILASVRSRHKSCKQCGENLFGKQAFKPATNAGNRYERICPACLAKFPKETKE